MSELTITGDDECEDCLLERHYKKIKQDHAFKTQLKSFSATDLLITSFLKPSIKLPFYTISSSTFLISFSYAFLVLSLCICPFLLLPAAAPTPAQAISSYFWATSQNCFHTFFHIPCAKYTTLWGSKWASFPPSRFLTQSANAARWRNTWQSLVFIFRE